MCVCVCVFLCVIYAIQVLLSRHNAAKKSPNLNATILYVEMFYPAAHTHKGTHIQRYTHTERGTQKRVPEKRDELRAAQPRAARALPAFSAAFPAAYTVAVAAAATVVVAACTYSAAASACVTSQS